MGETMISGIYLIVNKVNHKVYVGSSMHVTRRWKTHRTKLDQGTHENTHLQRSWDKHGQENFDFLLVAKCTKYELLDLEKVEIDERDAMDPNYGYNKIDPRSHEINEDTRRRMSESHIGKCSGEAHYLWGKHPAPETIVLMRSHRSRLGAILTDETKAKLREKALAISDETRQKMSDAAKRRWQKEDK